MFANAPPCGFLSIEPSDPRTAAVVSNGVRSEPPSRNARSGWNHHALLSKGSVVRHVYYDVNVKSTHPGSAECLPCAADIRNFILRHSRRLGLRMFLLKGQTLIAQPNLTSLWFEKLAGNGTNKEPFVKAGLARGNPKSPLHVAARDHRVHAGCFDGRASGLGKCCVCKEAPLYSLWLKKKLGSRSWQGTSCQKSAVSHVDGAIMFKF
jgi:hypothetical protein